MELSDLNYYRKNDDVKRFLREDGYRSVLLVLSDDTIAYFVTALQILGICREYTGVRGLVRNEAWEFVGTLEAGQRL